MRDVQEDYIKAILYKVWKNRYIGLVKQTSCYLHKMKHDLSRLLTGYYVKTFLIVSISGFLAVFQPC